ncbi:hypothetical protein FHR56_003121 [Xanthomonas sacchari]|nr:hypothetical protein [Xanthomonas sp. F10]
MLSSAMLTNLQVVGRYNYDFALVDFAHVPRARSPSLWPMQSPKRPQAKVSVLVWEYGSQFSGLEIVSCPARPVKHGIG